MLKTEENLANLRLGKESALSYFMDLYSHNLHFFAYKLVRDKDSIPEIISDSFVKLWKHRADFYTIEELKSFLYIVVRNSCLDHGKAVRERYVHQQIEEENILANPDADILTKIIHIELITLLGEALEKLPKQQADIFRLTVLEGKTTTEACQELQTTANTVYFARSKAVNTLRQLFLKKNISYYPLVVFLYLF
ncbi:RNA polymerase sigma factor [Sphingobacterium litopenaei]|uniref:Sigma-70 family RNA polymerase sigma factor n=1 Tax=Sphingobacterium litopenaei TaxID=2763500 RepID=A0ABR7YEU8_9SPHI|nr:sigma-70 family RNA polymerase sigma factor [Sphingobacterium litopenaei]MBD1429796.1 sigma-70 family RNA polymerase sigma factor [Sphingobacterium litopenaei]